MARTTNARGPARSVRRPAPAEGWPPSSRKGGGSKGGIKLGGLKDPYCRVDYIGT